MPSARTRRAISSTGGLGVGLPIARSIVELHGGTLSVARTFTIRLPRWQTVRNTDRIAVPVAIDARRIIVVDDNEDAAWLLAEALRLLSRLRSTRCRRATDRDQKVDGDGHLRARGMRAAGCPGTCTAST